MMIAMQYNRGCIVHIELVAKVTVTTNVMFELACIGC